MKKKRRDIVTVIRKSCITGKAVWIYQGPSSKAASLAYWRACKKEIHRVRHLWGLMVSRRGRNIARLLAECTERIPLTAEMTPEQREAARELQQMEKRETTCYRDFYNHIVEESKRKNEASRRWRENRLRWLKRNN